MYCIYGTYFVTTNLIASRNLKWSRWLKIPGDTQSLTLSPTSENAKTTKYCPHYKCFIHFSL